MIELRRRHLRLILAECQYFLSEYVEEFLGGPFLLLYFVHIA